MPGKKFLFLAGAMVLFLATVGTVLALDADYNRKNPLMDYVPQELGIFDTRYDHLGEMDCRACHGDSLADRHHYTDTVLRDQLCTPCHEIIPDPPGVVVIRDCTTSGCHSWNDVYANGWHHNTNLSESENCVACHDRNLVAEITPFSSFTEYPPSVVTPTPFSCENCHWDQATVDAVPGFVPGVSPDSDAGHPSTFDHYNEWGQFIGYYEYNKDVLGNFDTHHMGFKGNVASQCWKCHSNDPNDASWDPTNPELIRYCEICHDIGTLHTIFEHVGPPGTGGGSAVNGWEATGFHVPGASGNPTTYRTFEANEQCWGCHGDLVPPYTNTVAVAPNITGITPEAGCPGALVEISGTNFGETYIDGVRHVQFKVGVGVWQDVPIYSWADDLVVFEVPAWTFAPGNYLLRVRCDDAPAGQKNSNQVNFTLYDCASPKAINGNSNPAFDDGPCKSLIILNNGTGQFGLVQDVLSAPGADDGTYHTVEIAASQGTYVALNVTKWTNNEVRFRFTNFFEDLDGDYIQDTGEPTISICDGLALGTYSVYLKYIFYEDVDSSGGYTDGDTQFQVETSNPVTFELTNEPYITGLNPVKGSQANRTRVRVIGVNFGPTQTTGEVRVGTKAQYNSDPFNKGKVQTRIKLWSSTKVAFRLRVPVTWVGKARYVWVVKDGQVSNKRPLTILP